MWNRDIKFLLSLQRPGWSAVFLLPGAGPQVPGVLSHRAPLQDQAHLIQTTTSSYINYYLQFHQQFDFFVCTVICTVISMGSVQDFFLKLFDALYSVFFSLVQLMSITIFLESDLASKVLFTDELSTFNLTRLNKW